MADVTVTEANVRLGTTTNDAVASREEGAVAIARGKIVYKQSSDNKINLANNTTSVDTATVYGYAMTHTSADGDYLWVLTAGNFIPGGTLVKGEYYYLSSTDGGFSIHDDLTSGEYVTRLFYAISTTEAVWSLENTGITIT